jgi:hypothetical protein
MVTPCRLDTHVARADQRQVPLRERCAQTQDVRHHVVRGRRRVVRVCWRSRVCVCVCVWAQVFQREEGKKKPVMKRLGVTRDAILILDGETRVRVERRVVRS